MLRRLWHVHVAGTGVGICCTAADAVLYRPAETF